MGELQRSWRRRNVYITLTEGKAKVKKSQDHRDLLTGQFSQTRAELAKFENRVQISEKRQKSFFHFFVKILNSPNNYN